jgi:hypothetical protein
MRGKIVGVFLVFLPLGCVLGTKEREQGRGGELRKEAERCQAERIEISADASCGIRGGGVSSREWVLEKDGRCWGTVTCGSNLANTAGWSKTYELPPEVFAECKALLQKTNFFQMRERSEPQVLFENSCSSVKVKWNGRERSVLVTHPAPAPKGYDEVYSFVTGLDSRGKEIPPPGKAPEEAPIKKPN